MFSLFSNSNFSANSNSNPSMPYCYIQACRIPAGSCSGISTVSRVRVRIKVMVKDQFVKVLMWYGCSVPVAE